MGNVSSVHILAVIAAVVFLVLVLQKTKPFHGWGGSITSEAQVQPDHFAVGDILFKAFQTLVAKDVSGSLYIEQVPMIGEYVIRILKKVSFVGEEVPAKPLMKIRVLSDAIQVYYFEWPSARPVTMNIGAASIRNVTEMGAQYLEKFSSPAVSSPVLVQQS